MKAIVAKPSIAHLNLSLIDSANSRNFLLLVFFFFVFSFSVYNFGPRRQSQSDPIRPIGYAGGSRIKEERRGTVNASTIVAKKSHSTVNALFRQKNASVVAVSPRKSTLKTKNSMKPRKFSTNPKNVENTQRRKGSLPTANVFLATQTPRSVCPRVAARRNASDYFRSRFRPDVATMLIRNDILDENKLQNLSRLPAPFGLKYPGKEQELRFLASFPSFPTQRFLPLPPAFSGCFSCAVVGGGGVLRGAKLGARIDALDAVFRVNVARRRGFEVDVGKRMNVYVSYPYSFEKFVAADPEAFDSDAGNLQKVFAFYDPYHADRYLSFFDPKKKHWNTADRSGFRNVRNFWKPGSIHFIHPDFFRYVDAAFLRHNGWKPTTGFVTVMLALHLCDEVSLFGFSYGDSPLLHYYSVEKNVKKLTHHKIEVEYEVYKTLNQKGIIKWVR